MKIHSIYFRDFRSFRGEVTIDFCDPLSGTPRPITALAGTNGSGKTTILEAIEAIVQLVLGLAQAYDNPLIQETLKDGLAVLTFETAPTGQTEGIAERVSHIAVGEARLLPADHNDRWPSLIWHLSDEQHRMVFSSDDALTFTARKGPPSCKLLYFPSTRRQVTHQGGPIEPPHYAKRWVERIEDQDDWTGSLEQQWVWQNYLDLEQGVRTGKNLRPYVERIENLLGGGRRIFIEQGRVYVTQTDPNRKPVRLDQLPSGEKQILLLLGEIARRGRPGMVCLIDEPEISLHPAMQHALIHALRTYARQEDTQFILGTHSTEVVSALPGAVHFLDRLDIGEAPETAAVSEQAA